MSKLKELWIEVTKEREIEEYPKELRNLYDYTMKQELVLDKIKEICEKQFIDFEGHNKRYAPVNTREIIEVLEKIND